jgi:hypothetical protein
MPKPTPSMITTSEERDDAPPKQPGLYFVVDPETGAITVAVRDRTGFFATAKIAADELGSVIVALLQTAHEGALQSDFDPPPVESYDGLTVPIWRLGLFGNTGSPQVMMLTVGQAALGFEVTAEKLREIGTAFLEAGGAEKA